MESDLQPTLKKQVHLNMIEGFLWILLRRVRAAKTTAQTSRTWGRAESRFALRNVGSRKLVVYAIFSVLSVSYSAFRQSCGALYHSFLLVPLAHAWPASTNASAISALIRFWRSTTTHALITYSLTRLLSFFLTLSPSHSLIL